MKPLRNGYLSLFDFGFVDALLPERLRGPRQSLEAQRARLIVVLAVLLTVLTGGFGIVYVVVGARAMAAVAFAAVALTLVPPVLLRLGTSVRAAGHMYVGLALLVIGALNVLAGGSEPVLLAWFLLPTMLGYMAISPRAGLAWGVGSTVACLTLVGLARSGVAFPDVLREHKALFMIAAASALVAVGTGAFYLYGQVERWLSDTVRLREEIQRTILNTAPDAIVSVDERGTIGGANRAAASVFGCDADRLIGRSIAELVPTLEPWGHQPSGEAEHTGVRADGDRFPVHISTGQYTSGKRTHSVVILRDVTDSKRAERELQAVQQAALAQSRQSFQALIDASPDGIAIFDGETIVYANESLAELSGYDCAELLDLDPIQLTPHDQRDSLLGLLRTMPGSSEELHAMECGLLRRDGVELQVEVRIFVSWFDAKPAVIVLVRDLTEQKQLRAQMMHMDRMIAVGTLAAGVAHEINNPLSFLKANIDMLLDEVSHGGLSRWQAPVDQTFSRGDLLEMLTDAADGSERIRRIVQDLKTFATRQEAQPAAEIDIAGVVESSLKIAHNEIKHRARLVVDLEPDLPPVLSHRSDLGQVFLTLLTNAAQAIAPGSADTNCIEVCARRDAQAIVVEVRDTGSGIPPEVQARVFDPFFSTKRQDEGMGLGLYITRNIVRKAGGELSFVTSEQGTTFTVRLPVATSPDPAPASQEETQQVPRARVLVVDDEVQLLKAMRRLLSGHDVVCAASGTEALDILDADPRFDLILCDLQMPQMSGASLYEAVRERHRQLTDRMVFMSGGTFTTESSEFVETLAHAPLAKPFGRETLDGVLTAFINA